MKFIDDSSDILVSIVVTTYNVSSFLDMCLSSIVSQTYKNLEIVIVDDSSTDDTREKLRAWAERDRRIKLVLKQNNEGGAYAKRTGAEHVTGDFFLFCDGDDFIDTSAVSACIAAYKEVGADCVVFGFDYYNTESDSYSPKVVPIFSTTVSPIVDTDTKLFDPVKFGNLTHITPVCFMSSAVHRAAFVSTICNLRYFYDLPTYIAMLNCSEKIVFLDSAFYHYRIGREGQSIDGWAVKNRPEKLMDFCKSVKFISNKRYNLKKKIRTVLICKAIIISEVEINSAAANNHDGNLDVTISNVAKAISRLSIFDLDSRMRGDLVRLFVYLKIIPRPLLRRYIITGSFVPYLRQDLFGRYVSSAINARLRQRRRASNRAVLDSSNLFDRSWYLSGNDDVRGMDPTEHYLSYGGFEGRAASPDFDSARYLAENADVRAAGVNPLVHYLLHGRQEGRHAFRV